MQNTLLMQGASLRKLVPHKLVLSQKKKAAASQLGLTKVITATERDRCAG